MTTITDADRIASRYPSTKRPWYVWPIVGVCLLFAVGWTVVSVIQANPPIRAAQVSFNANNPRETTLVFSVQRPDPSVTGKCLVYAETSNHEWVGEVVVPIPASDQKAQEFTQKIRTFRPGVYADVERCWTTN